MTSPVERKNSLLIHIGAIFAVTAWGLSFVMTKVLLDNGLGPVAAYVYRMVIAYALMVLLSHNRMWCRNLRDELLFVLMGMCAGSIYFISENTALEYTLVTNVSLITTASPLLTAMLVGFVYKNEKPSRGVILGSFIALLGVGLVVFNSAVKLQLNPLGDFLALLAALSWAVYSIVLRRLNATYDVVFITRKMFFYGLITAVPFMLVKGEALALDALANPVVWGNLLGLGLMCSVVAFVVFNEAVKRLGAVTASNYLYFQPIVTLIFSVIILNEAVSFIGYAGCGLILLGVFLSDYLSRPHKLNRKRL